jgi:thiamine biosynthesis lipoprotein
MKKAFVIGLISCFVTAFSSCASENKSGNEESKSSFYYSIQGEAQGTTYTITYKDTLSRDFSMSIDSLLKDYDQHLSTYVDSSLISKFNKVYSNAPSSGLSTFDYDFAMCQRGPKSVFEECVEISKTVYNNTNGAFNPAIFPLVQYWGFFKKDSVGKELSQFSLDSIIVFSKFDDSTVYFTTDSAGKGGVHFGCYPVLVKMDGRIQLDFNGIAQGHSVDKVALFLESQGIKNYMVEIGGEVRTLGKNHTGNFWRIGIDKPVEDSTPGSEGFQFIVSLDGKSLATSGSYRKYYEKEGQKFSHTIDPKTGRPVKHNLISVTVIANESALADAYATAFMVMGVEQSISFIESHPELELEAYFITDENGSWKEVQTKGFASFISK